MLLSSGSLLLRKRKCVREVQREREGGYRCKERRRSEKGLAFDRVVQEQRGEAQRKEVRTTARDFGT